jgi:hypothetical protein
MHAVPFAVGSCEIVVKIFCSQLKRRIHETQGKELEIGILNPGQKVYISVYDLPSELLSPILFKNPFPYLE